jgi:hypothetical protein
MRAGTQTTPVANLVVYDLGWQVAAWYGDNLIRRILWVDSMRRKDDHSSVFVEIVVQARENKVFIVISPAPAGLPPGPWFKLNAACYKCLLQATVLSWSDLTVLLYLFVGPSPNQGQGLLVSLLRA